MASTSSLNRNNSAVKRIMQEARELANDPSTDYTAAPLEDDIFEWHCTIRGPQGTEFEGGLYHVRILLPAEYPFRPPSLMVLTPNGRFELNTKICISFTNYHEELWQPAWGVRTAILGLQGFFPLKGQAAVGVGSIEFPASERKRLAELSRTWTCAHCQQSNLELLPDPVSPLNSHFPPLEMQETSDNVEVESTGDPARSTPPTQPANTPESPVDQSPSFQASSAISDTRNNAAPIHTQDSPESGTLPVHPVSFSERQGQVYPSSNRPPFLLDTAICVLLVLVFALICRRML